MQTETQPAQPSRAGSSTVLKNGAVLDKVSLYRWMLRDEPGELVLIPKDQLTVDHAYQRAPNETKILAIARDWSWLACGVITVANRHGRLLTVDGQHRVRAAMKRSDISTLPCLVFTSDSVETEAAGFLATNTLRKPLDSFAKFRALVMTGHPAALAVERYALFAGRNLAGNTGPTTIACVSSLMKPQSESPDELARIWPLIVALCQGQPLNERIVMGMVYIETHMPEGQSLSALKWSERVLKVGYAPILAGAQKAAIFHNRGGAKTWAIGIQQAINHGLRMRLVLDNEVQSDAQD